MKWFIGSFMWYDNIKNCTNVILETNINFKTEECLYVSVPSWNIMPSWPRKYTSLWLVTLVANYKNFMWIRNQLLVVKWPLSGKFVMDFKILKHMTFAIYLCLLRKYAIQNVSKLNSWLKYIKSNENYFMFICSSFYKILI